MQYGKRINVQNGVLYYLGNRYVPEEMVNDPEVEKLIGTTVVLSRKETHVITVYRNIDGPGRKKRYYSN